MRQGGHAHQQRNHPEGANGGHDRRHADGLPWPGGGNDRELGHPGSGRRADPHGGVGLAHLGREPGPGGGDIGHGLGPVVRRWGGRWGRRRWHLHDLHWDGRLGRLPGGPRYGVAAPSTLSVLTPTPGPMVRGLPAAAFGVVAHGAACGLGRCGPEDSEQDGDRGELHGFCSSLN